MTAVLAAVTACALAAGSQTAEPEPAAGVGSQPPSVPALDGAPVRVEQRLLVKEHRLFVLGGFALLDRGNYYTHPGATVSAAFYPDERYAFELRTSFFVPVLNRGAQEVFSRLGLVPDAQAVHAAITAGGRVSAGYGKLALMPLLQSVLHFDLQITAHAGVTVSDRAVNPVVLAGPALLVRFGHRLHGLMEAPLALGFEKNQLSSGVAIGAMPSISLGVAL